MSFLDKLNQTLNKAGEKANELANVAKIKMDISKYNSSINSKYQKLGEMIYKSEKEGLDSAEEKLTYINEIDMLFEEVAKLNVMLAEISVDKDAPVPVSYEAPVQTEGKICPNCGKANEMAAVFCAGCGTKIG